MPFAPAGFQAFFGFVIVFIVVGFVATIFLAIRNAMVLKRRGVDPISPGADLLGRLAQSDLLQPSAHGSVENRLAKIDALLDAGEISQAERDAARAKILGEL